jgi:hypothetical protein
MIRLLNSLAKTIGDTWCQIMHPDPMWPVRGEYQCRVCQRRFPVAWEKPIVEPTASAAKSEAITPATVPQTY